MQKLKNILNTESKKAELAANTLNKYLTQVNSLGGNNLKSQAVLPNAKDGKNKVLSIRENESTIAGTEFSAELKASPSY